MKILHYYVEISDGKGIISARNEFSTTELDILGENDRYMVVNNLHFTTIDKQASEYSIGAPLDKASIHISTADSVWGNLVTYSLYTFKQKKAATIRKEIEKAIIKKLGFFLNGVDLSVIDDRVKRKAAQGDAT